MFNVLPVFHSFGLTGGLMMPLIGGVPVYLYPSPLHYRIVPELIYDTGATILFGTDTFLTGYARSAHPYDFRTAAPHGRRRRSREGPHPRRSTWSSFGVRILEGYGVTETAPVLAMNTPIANKSGTVGRLVAADGGPPRSGGRHRGGRPAVRARAQRHARLLRAENPGVLEAAAGRLARHRRHRRHRRAGFITIKGRAKRFAKIGGEMVSLSAVEAMAAELWPSRSPWSWRCPMRARASGSCC